jgi:hypothetical protein
MNATTTENAARTALRENIKRLAGIRRKGGRIDPRLCWPERQLLFSLVHGMVCESPEYDPTRDAQVLWAGFFLRICSAWPYEVFPDEEAVLQLIEPLAEISHAI